MDGQNSISLSPSMGEKTMGLSFETAGWKRPIRDQRGKLHAQREDEFTIVSSNNGLFSGGFLIYDEGTIIFPNVK